MPPLPIEIAAGLILLIIGGLLYSLGYQIGDALVLRHAKDKLYIPNPSKWLKNMYKLYMAKQVLPTMYTKPSTDDSDPVSPVLPKCPKLDGAEKGKNIMFRVRAPCPNTTSETKITISSLV